MMARKLPALWTAAALLTSAMPALAETACYSDGVFGTLAYTTGALPRLRTAAIQGADTLAGLIRFNNIPPLNYTLPVGGSVIVKEVGPSAMMLTVGPFRDGSGGELWTCRSAEISRTPNTWSCKVVLFSDNRPRDITLIRVGAPCSMDVTPPPA